jgi:hypothetical protein
MNIGEEKKKKKGGASKAISTENFAPRFNTGMKRKPRRKRRNVCTSQVEKTTCLLG